MRFVNWTDAEIQRWLWLRAIEWNVFPAFASQPLVPIMFLLFSWYWVVAAVVALNILWSVIRYSYVNITAAIVTCLFVAWAKWPFAIGSTIYLFIHLKFVPGLIALFWPLLAGLIPPSGKIGVIELAFAKKIGYVPGDAELQSAVWYHKAAKRGDADAQYNLGRLYYEGRGVPQDYAQAVAWHRKAAEQGDAVAQCSLGLMYIEGQGVPQDYTQAAFWVCKAAEQGVAVAQSLLGYMYKKGWGVPQDHTKAVAWYRKAAEQGYAEAQSAMGEAYYFGQGVPLDDAQAATWFRKAAEQGVAVSQFLLGNLYCSGRGIPQDYAEAYFWLDVAAADKLNVRLSEQIVKDRHKAASHMTPADHARAQERARKWLDAHKAKPQ